MRRWEMRRMKFSSTPTPPRRACARTAPSIPPVAPSS